MKFEDSNIMLIDDATRKNLELTKTMDGSREGSFLNNIDFTKTGGEEKITQLVVNTAIQH